MELTFQKTADRWVAEFEASADFNLHIEGVVEGNVSLFQRGTASGAYAYVKGATPSPSYSRCYDYDFTSLVYPKFIKVSCATEPTYAEVISSGEVTELKFHEKAVEITANGTHTIAPDAGFAALNAVSVKVNVPQGGGGSASSVEYWDVSSNNETIGEIALFFPWVRDDNAKNITSAWGLSTPNANITAVVLDRNSIIALEGEKMTIGEFLEYSGLSDLSLLGWKQITKEEFYTL